MSRLPRFKCSVGIVLLAATLLCGPACAQPSLDNQLAVITERAYVAPREALHTLAKLQAANAPLPPRLQALAVEQSSHAKFYAGDFGGALQDGRQLEALGQQQGDASAECLGLLSQVYAYWMMGKIETAYALVRRAEQFAPSTISTTVRVRVLLTRAQLESEEHHAEAALRTVDEAMQLGRKSRDPALLFMATKAQATTALAAGDTRLAVAAVDQLVALSVHSRYRERLVRAKAVEYAVASAAGQTARASQAMGERIALMRELHLDEVLGRTLVEYSDLQLKSQRYADAAALSEQALRMEPVLAEEALAGRAHFNHAIATVHLGKLAAGKAEVERLFAASRQRLQLAAYLPQYVVALAQAGDVDGSVQAGALQQQMELEATLRHAREDDKAQGRIEALARESRAKTLEAANERAQRNGWLVAAVTAAAGLIGILFLYRRLRLSNRLLERTNLQLYASSNRDSLTGLFNRRYVESYVARLARRATDDRAPVPAACGLVLLMDVDHFKRLNDTHGHAVGDAVLQVTAERLSALFRSEDILVRWGGEEFLALLPRTDPGEAAAIVARVLGAVSASPVVVGQVSMNVTMSVGVCSLMLSLKDRALNWEEVVNLADQALYLAKQNGRNMAYGITGTVNATTAEMARGLGVLWGEGKAELFEVVGRV